MNLYAVFFVDPTNWYCIQLPEKKEFTGSESREERKTEWWNKNPLISFVREAGESRIPWAERKEFKGKCCKKEKKKKKKGKKRKMSVIQRLWKSTMRESLIYTNIFLEIMWSLPWINTYKEEPQKNLRFLRIFISIFTPSSLQIRLMLTLPGIFSDGLSGRRSVQGIRRGGMFMTGCTLSRIIVDWRDDFGWRARHVKGLWKGVVVERAM